MKHYLEYGTKKTKCIEINVNPSVPFPRIVKTITQIAIKNCSNAELIHYTVLELVSNAVRSHLEKQVKEIIKVVYAIDENMLHINIEDRGGGFDLKLLPYDITMDPHDIDLNSPQFLSYREGYGYARFGMGILSAKRLFHDLKIQFVTHSGITEAWSNNAIGTHITGTITLIKDNDTRK